MALVELGEIVQVLNAISAVAVLAGVVFVVFQLRQNAKLIEASNRQVEASFQQNKSSVALGIVERFTDDSFTKRRKTVRDIIRKYGSNYWKDFSESSDDFEVRAFGSYYEFIAYLARKKIVEPETLQEALGHRLTFDWDAFAPAAEFYRKIWGKKYIFENFEWLAQVTRRFLVQKERELTPQVAAA